MRSICYGLLLTIVLSTACSNDYKSYFPTPNPLVVKDTLRSIYYGQQQSAILDLAIQYKKRYFSGLLIFKYQSKDQSYRTVFATKTGQTIFDLTIFPEKYRINQCVKRLNKKIILNLIVKDFRLIIGQHTVSEETLVLSDTLNQQTLYRQELPAGFFYYYYDNNTNELIKIERGSKKRRKVVADFGEELVIEHLKLPLTLKVKAVGSGQ